jgi:hypothetical protein
MNNDYISFAKEILICFTGTYLGVFLGDKVCNRLAPIIKGAAYKSIFEQSTRINHKTNSLENKVNKLK